LLRELRALIRRAPFARSVARGIRGLVRTETLAGMTSRAEQAFFRNYAERVYSGKGEIVDLGSWLGSTTIPLARGLRRNPRGRGRRVQAYDQFVWQEWMEPYAGHLQRRYTPGESFLDEFRRRIGRDRTRIDVHAGDLRLAATPEFPIEFLLVDVMKSWDLARVVVERFYPRLIPGDGLLLHQDFKHYYTPWIHLIQWRFRDCFVPECDVPNTGSFVFRLVRPLSVAGDWLETLRAADDDEIERAFDYSRSLVPDGSRASVAAAQVMLWIHRGRRDRAEIELQRMVRAGYSVESELRHCARILTPETGTDCGSARSAST
jgi:hypothetical protein